MSYSVRELLKVTRVVKQILTDNPELLNKEGVFRVSGEQTRVNELVDHILDPTHQHDKASHISTMDYDIHEYIGALKKVFRECDDIDPRLYSSLVGYAKSRVKSPSLDPFLEELIKTEDINNIYYAEALYSIFQIINTADPYSATTRMNPGSFGIVIGPNLCSDSDKGVIEALELFKDFAASIIASKVYDQSVPFHEYIDAYKSELTPILLNTRETALQQVTKKAQDEGRFVNGLQKEISTTKQTISELQQQIRQINSDIEHLNSTIGEKGVKKKDIKSIITRKEQEKVGLLEKVSHLQTVLIEREANYKQIASVHQKDVVRLFDLRASLSMFKPSGASASASSGVSASVDSSSRTVSDKNDDIESPDHGESSRPRGG